jgi:hypothetical protein
MSPGIVSRPAAVVSGLMLVAFVSLLRASEPVAFFGSGPVFADEFAFYSARLRTSVASRLMRKHGVEMTAGFWSTQLGEATPEEHVCQAALEEIARSRAIQSLAVEAGLIEAAQSFNEIVAEWESENENRKAMKARGEVFYGPVNFSQEAYFTIKFDQLLKALELSAGDGTATDGTNTKSTVQDKLAVRIASMMSSCSNEKHPNDPDD